MNRQSTAVLDHDDVDEASGESYRSSRLGDRLTDRQAPVPRRVLPRVTPDDLDQDDTSFLRTQTRIRVRRGLIPESRWGRIAAGCGLFVALAAMVASLLIVRNFLLHDPRFLIDSSADIQIEGNSHVSRPQLLSIFGEDIGRNLFYVSLAQRRTDLETLPWVEHATVMRLLPNRLRVSVVERTPVAFVRQGGRIGLADAYGVLLDLPQDDPQGAKYSFPVLTGISAADPLSTRTARMKVYQQFIKELDSSGPKLSESLSEVDVANPEDVKALIPDHSSEILVHFGDENFLERYQRYQQQIPTWRAQYPNLASVDMRYPNQVVLDMASGTNAKVPATDGIAPGAPSPDATVSVPAITPPAPPATNPASGKKSAATPMAPPAAAPVAKAVTPAPVKAAPSAAVKTPAVKPATSPAPTLSAVKASAPATKTATVKPAVAPAPAAKTPTPATATVKPTAAKPAKTPLDTSAAAEAAAEKQYSTQHPLTQAFDAPAKKPVAKNKPSAKGQSAVRAARVVKSKAKPAAKKPSAAQVN